MEELHAVADDQSHYEISLTAGQAFAAFVLLLLSLAASFAFGLMMGKGQADDRLVVRRETPVVTEAGLTPKKSSSRIVELGVEADEFQDPGAGEVPLTETVAAVVEETPPVAGESAAASAVTTPASATPAETVPAAVAATLSAQEVSQPARITTYAQLLSTSDQKTAENLAARLIDRGFDTAYVERGTSDKGPAYRVRVKYDSEQQARAAEPRLREFSKEVWITTK